jgi:hypothetical protein
MNLKTLYEIVEKGLGGKVEIAIEIGIRYQDRPGAGD